jgi:hypothetical protein
MRRTRSQPLRLIRDSDERTACSLSPNSAAIWISVPTQTSPPRWMM